MNHATVGDRCNRIDVFYCGTVISGLAEGVRVDRDPRECFSADQAYGAPDTLMFSASPGDTIRV